ncbi:MAG: DUF4093 domain-containing protein [Clostridia bacterium]|nr:DUF4093 domain-containing protein [Clostridia bacterium]
MTDRALQEGDRPVIRETIVVEGRDDEAAVLRAVDAPVLCTHGWGLNEEILARIGAAYGRTGIIVLTDPDHAGETIRKRLSALFPEAKHAWIGRAEGSKMRAETCVDVGVENASPEVILAALNAAKAVKADRPADPMTPSDLAALGLSGLPESASLREVLGKELGIGGCNAKTFVKRANAFGISREELQAAWDRISRENR